MINNAFINKTNVLLFISIILIIIIGSFFKVYAVENQHPIKLLTVSNRLAKEALSCKLLLYIYKSDNPSEFTACYKFNLDIIKFIDIGKYNTEIETYVIGLNDTQFKNYIKNKEMINYVYFRIIKNKVKYNVGS